MSDHTWTSQCLLLWTRQAGPVCTTISSPHNSAQHGQWQQLVKDGGSSGSSLRGTVAVAQPEPEFGFQSFSGSLPVLAEVCQHNVVVLL
jgi:hypothetical protein